MPIDRPPREVAFTPLFTVRLDPDTRYLTIPEFAKMLADAKFPHMQDELDYGVAVALDASLQNKPKYAHFAGVPPNPGNVALQRKCAEVSYMAEMQFAVRDSRLRIFSPLTYRPVAVPYEQNPRWQQDVNAAIVPIDDLVEYAENCLVLVEFGEGAELGEVLPSIDAASPFGSGSSRREERKARTAAMHQSWIDESIAIKRENERLSNWAIATQLRRRIAKTQSDAPAVKTISNIISGKV